MKNKKRKTSFYFVKDRKIKLSEYQKNRLQEAQMLSGLRALNNWKNKGLNEYLKKDVSEIMTILGTEEEGNLKAIVTLQPNFKVVLQ